MKTRAVLKFEEHHPFELPDGRRFASLYCAAHSAFMAANKLFPIREYRDGKLFFEHNKQDAGSARPPELPHRS